MPELRYACFGLLQVMAVSLLVFYWLPSTAINRVSIKSFARCQVFDAGYCPYGYAPWPLMTVKDGAVHDL
jgi:hypothetical protein